MHSKEVYSSPFNERWCRRSPLLGLFSEQNKVETWRQLWIWLAEAERDLGLDELISVEMIEELKAQQRNIDWELVQKKEAALKHDVMAHIQTYAQICPKAEGIIHLGVTSCFVQDNADLIIQRRALEHIIERLAICLDRLAKFALEHAAVPTVGKTHFQDASLTTIGKRAAMWADGLLHAFHKLKAVHSEMRFRGVKGAVGTQDALLQLFNGDSAKVKALDAAVTEKAGFQQAFDICGQTYPRYQDSDLVYALALLASASHKFAFDLRHLQAEGEISEPFEEDQVGSSAMPYKRNPIRSERICSIGRYLISLVPNPLYTFADQGFERTLDDSANRRIVIPEAFLAADAILSVLQNILEGLRINTEAVTKNVKKAVSNACLERALMLLTERDKDRQRAHHRIKEITLKLTAEQSEEPKNVVDQLPEIRKELMELCDHPIRLCGTAEEQTRTFVVDTLKPAIEPTICKMLNATEKKQLDV